MKTVLALCAVMAALVMVVSGEDADYGNTHPFLATGYDSHTESLHLAFAPMVAVNGDLATQVSVGLETRQCAANNQCDDYAGSTELVSCRGTQDEKDDIYIVEDISVQFPGNEQVFKGEYLLYTVAKKNVNDDTDNNPAFNTVMMAICETLQCLQTPATQAIDRIVTTNAYQPTMTFVTPKPGSSYPAIAYVQNPADHLQPLPSDSQQGKLMINFCNDAYCQDDPTIVTLDECTIDGMDGNFCSAPYVVKNGEGYPQVLYQGAPEDDGKEGTWLKVATCQDVSCSQVGKYDLVQVDSEPGLANPAEAMMVTRLAGHPAAVFTNGQNTGGKAIKLMRCNTMDCASPQFETIYSPGLSATSMHPYMALNEAGIPMIVYVRKVNQGTSPPKKDLVFVLCKQKECTSHDDPIALTECSDGSCSPVHPKITAVGDSHTAITYWDEIQLQSFMFICSNDNCTMASAANKQTLGLQWAENACNIAPSGGHGGSPKKHNGGAIAAGIIFTLIAIVGIAVFAYWFLVVRKGGRWPWEQIGQPKDLDQYAEL